MYFVGVLTPAKDGGYVGPDPLHPLAEARGALLPAPGRQPSRAGGAEAVPSGRLSVGSHAAETAHHHPGLSGGGRDHQEVAGQPADDSKVRKGW